MKKLTALAIVATLALPVGGAYALDAKVKSGAAGSADAATSTAATGVDATATGSVSGDTYGSLISSLNAGKSTVDFNSLSADADITIVNVSSLKAEGNTTALDNALDKNKASLTTLHADITANADLAAKLQAQGVMIESIVAVSAAADGTLTVFVDDRV